jgi:hypothetical protein
MGIWTMSIGNKYLNFQYMFLFQIITDSYITLFSGTMNEGFLFPLFSRECFTILMGCSLSFACIIKDITVILFWLFEDKVLYELRFPPARYIKSEI